MKESITLHRKILLLKRFSFILLGLGILAVSLELYGSSQEQKRYQSYVKEHEDLLQAKTATANLRNLALSELEGLTAIGQIFPDESSIITTLEDLESLIREYDPAGTVRFSSQGSKSVQEGVSLVMHFRSTPTQVLSFLRRLERLPYILEITQLEFALPSGITNPAEVTLGVILYVQNPFTHPD